MATEQSNFDVVGFGGGDSTEAGVAFVAEHGLSFPNLFDESRDLWDQLGVSGQPAWILYGADGALLGRGAGAVVATEIAALVP